MGLLDHFRPPLHPVRHWESFHAAWAVAISEDLNARVLPSGYFAESQIHVGSRVEVDVATFDLIQNRKNYGGTAVADVEPEVWIAPPPMETLPTIFPDSIEVLVYADDGGAALAAAIELVSPGNKDREESRRAFTFKCASYLQQGVGLAIVDIVTVRRANLHEKLLETLGRSSRTTPASDLYASSYRPVRREDSDVVETWALPLQIGAPLTTIPLALRRGPTVPLDLDSTYALARNRSYFGRTHALPVDEE